MRVSVWGYTLSGFASSWSESLNSTHTAMFLAWNTPGQISSHAEHRSEQIDSAEAPVLANRYD